MRAGDFPGSVVPRHEKKSQSHIQGRPLSHLLFDLLVQSTGARSIQVASHVITISIEQKYRLFFVLSFLWRFVVDVARAQNHTPKTAFHHKKQTTQIVCGPAATGRCGTPIRHGCILRQESCLLNNDKIGTGIYIRFSSRPPYFSTTRGDPRDLRQTLLASRAQCRVGLHAVVWRVGAASRGKLAEKFGPGVCPTANTLHDDHARPKLMSLYGHVVRVELREEARQTSKCPPFHCSRR